MNHIAQAKNLFDGWALTERVEQMKRGHLYSVNTYLEGLDNIKDFSFLDVGCGDGWVVRKMAKEPKCSNACGIDLSSNMIQLAVSRTTSSKESFIAYEFLKWENQNKYDLIFSMESLYYIHPLEKTLAKLYELLSQNGKIIVGTDLYHENPISASWPEMLGLNMDFRDKQGWEKLFDEAGFKNIELKQIVNPSSDEAWQRECGTLFISANK